MPYKYPPEPLSFTSWDDTLSETLKTLKEEKEALAEQAKREPSKADKREAGWRLQHHAYHPKTGHVFISTAPKPHPQGEPGSRGYETHVFAKGKPSWHGTKKIAAPVDFSSELHHNSYDTQQDAEKGHVRALKKFGGGPLKGRRGPDEVDEPKHQHPLRQTVQDSMDQESDFQHRSPMQKSQQLRQAARKETDPKAKDSLARQAAQQRAFHHLDKKKELGRDGNSMWVGKGPESPRHARLQSKHAEVAKMLGRKAWSRKENTESETSEHVFDKQPSFKETQSSIKANQVFQRQDKQAAKTALAAKDTKAYHRAIGLRNAAKATEHAKLTFVAKDAGDKTRASKHGMLSRLRAAKAQDSFEKAGTGLPRGWEPSKKKK